MIPDHGRSQQFQSRNTYQTNAQAKANASLDTKVNNSSITSNTINITSSYTPKEVTEGSQVNWSGVFKNQDKIKKNGKKLQDSWLALQEAKGENGDLKNAQKKFKNALFVFGLSVVSNIDKDVLQNNLNLIYNKNNGNITIAGGNLSGENININSDNNLTLKTQKEIHASLNAGMNATAESIGSAFVAIPVDFRGNIENGEDNDELKDALQISLSSSSGKQSDIQADNLTINTTNNTTLSGSHIGAENGTINTGTLTEKELVHQGFQIAQRLDDGRDIWGQYGSPNKGVITGDSIHSLIFDYWIGNAIRKDLGQEEKKLGMNDVLKMLKLGDFKLKGDMSFSKATHQATISQGVDVKITNTTEPSSEIKRGEAQSQTQMQITKTQNKDTDVKNLAKDAINGVNKITDKVTNLVEDAKTFVDDVKNSLSKI